MARADNGARITDGSTTFEGGIDSGRIPTIASQSNPHGLARNELSWATNATMRGGGISPRAGWKRLTKIKSAPGLFQGGQIYEPDFAFPYLMVDISGRTYQIRVDTDNSVFDVTTAPMPATEVQHWIRQGEQFLITQDGVSEPRVWDGNQQRLISAMGGAAPFLPIGQSMDYFMGRMWVAFGREYMAGDIVRGPTGTAPYQFRDSILHSIENTYLSGGGNFIVPTNAGNIRSLDHTANLDTQLGEGQLYISTRRAIYTLNVPPTRAVWNALTEPLQRIAQITFGITSDRSVAPANGDLFYQSIDGIRSLLIAVRDFQQWGQSAISRELNRVLQFNDRSLSRFGTGINFSNRILQSVLPKQTDSGVIHQGIVALDFDLISNLGSKLSPVWEGMSEGLQILQMWSADFGGLERAFAAVVSQAPGSIGDIELWELTQQDINDEDDRRIQWYIETPAYTWGTQFSLKKLDTAEIWIDRLIGKVEFKVQFRVDQDPCWYDWYEWQECSARTSCELATDPVCYPEDTYCPGYRATMTLPTPPAHAGHGNNRPINIGYQFQLRIFIKGYCRIRGILVHALPRDKRPFEGIVTEVAT